MDREKVIEALIFLGKEITKNISNELFQNVIQKNCEANLWFKEDDVRYAISSIALWLNEDILYNFCGKYQYTHKPKSVAVIMAGNIPAVGFADMLHVLLSGHNFIGKLSHQDKILLPFMVEIMKKRVPEINNIVKFSCDKINNFDAVIATGSNNSASYFEYYFRNYPHIIRKNRSSIAIISNNFEYNNYNFSSFADDVLLYFGLGCRNVSKIYLPVGFDLEIFTKVFASHSKVLDHNKYRNNYEYHKAIYIMNNVSFFDSGVVLMLENKNLHSPVSVLNYEYYNNNTNDIYSNIIENNKEEIQCIVSDKHFPNTVSFGKAQQPAINDFADGIDTMKFLELI
ncbi:MAG: hypothetical protein LBR28_04275 [Bacteroidales bacterium]|jgi:hypothetical protein|nr:hypothetical protein [Bacteroidales bacterium]